MVSETNAFLTWFSMWGQVLYLAIQVAFWAALGFAAVMIAVQYKRFVDYKAGKVTPKDAPTSAVPAGTIAIDEFVE